MKPSQVSILVIRLASVYLLVNSVPYFVYLWVDMGYRHAKIDDYLWLYVRQGLEIVFSILIWLLAPVFSRSIVTRADEEPVKMNYSEVVAIGISVISIIFILNGARGLAHWLLWDVRADTLLPVVWQMLRDNHGMPLELPLGIILLLFAPRIAILLDNRFFELRGNGDE